MTTYASAGRSSEIPEGEARVVEIDGESVAICHVAGAGFFALENRCSHDDGPLGEGTLVDDRIECPRHGALFDVRTGDAKTLPAVRGVKHYEVRVDGDEIQVGLD